MTGWQQQQLDHMQSICTSLQTDNHASISSLKSFTGQKNVYRPNALPDAQPTVSRHRRHKERLKTESQYTVSVAEYPRLASVVHYRGVRQLHKYNALLHAMQLLMLQRQLMLDVGQRVVSLLQQMDTNDRFVMMY